MSGPIARLRLIAPAVVALFVLACAPGGTTSQPATESPSPAAVVTATLAPTPVPSASTTPSQPPASTSAPVVVGKFTIVAGVEEFAIKDAGVMTTDDGVDKGRGLTLKNVDVANDPRVSGTTIETWNYDFAGLPPEAGLSWGVRRLVNEGGSWEGIVLGSNLGAGREELTMWLAGAGGYAGLSYYMHAFSADPSTPSYPFEGIIYEGTIPIPTFATP
jgi:hypothetical protein